MSKYFAVIAQHVTWEERGALDWVSPHSASAFAVEKRQEQSGETDEQGVVCPQSAAGTGARARLRLARKILAASVHTLPRSEGDLRVGTNRLSQ